MRISDWSSGVCSSDLGFRLSSVGAVVAKYANPPIFGADVDEAAEAVGGHIAVAIFGAVEPGHHLFGKFVAEAVAHLGSVSHPRSEEHTSELQALMRLSHAVFALKKKTGNTTPIHSRRMQKYNNT